MCSRSQKHISQQILRLASMLLPLHHFRCITKMVFAEGIRCPSLDTQLTIWSVQTVHCIFAYFKLVLIYFIYSVQYKRKQFGAHQMCVQTALDSSLHIPAQSSNKASGKRAERLQRIATIVARFISLLATTIPKSNNLCSKTILL